MPDKILVRATNWVGDAVMSLPALRALRQRFPQARISILAKPWVADLYRREPFCNDLIPYTLATLGEKWAAARALRPQHFDCAILLQNAFEAAAIAYLAGIPERIGYARDGRGFLLTDAIPVPKPGEIPRHERFYYLELLRRAGIVDELPCRRTTRSAWKALPPRASPAWSDFANSGWARLVIGVSPGAAYGTAKRWLPERFADSANRLASELGTARSRSSDRKTSVTLCESVAASIPTRVKNFAGETSLAEFIDLAAACRVYLTNDSGAMHIASALGVPTVAVFGATDDVATGPTGPLAKVVREPVECSPCLQARMPHRSPLHDARERRRG